MYDPTCQLCALHSTCRSVCMGASGNPTPEILFVGEAPGAEEDQHGQPFVGAAGLRLRDAMDKAGLMGRKWAMTNTVKCRPPNNATPLAAHVKACAPYLEAEIQHFKPRVIVPVGNVALKALTGKTGITRYAGRVLLHEDRIYFPIVHPSGTLHNPKLEAPFRESLKLLARWLDTGGQSRAPDFPESTIEEFFQLLDGEGPLALDLETTDVLPQRGDIRTLAISDGKQTAWIRMPLWSGLIAERLHDAYVKRQRPMVAQNATFEIKWLLYLFRKHHLDWHEVSWPVADTMLYHYLLDENAPHDLDFLSQRYTDMGGYSDQLQALLLEGYTHATVPLEVLGPYNAADAKATFLVFERLRAQLMCDTDLWGVWKRLLGPSVWTVARLELEGRKVDVERLATLEEELTEEVKESRALLLADPYVQAAAAERELPFNPGSTQQMADVLFKRLRVPVIDKTPKGKPSMRALYLKPFTKDFPLVKTYLDFKSAETLLVKYVHPLKEYVQADSFLYGGYLLHGTVTGRLSSVSPNLQNFNKRLRTIVVSRHPGGLILEADYKNLELRLMAWLTECKVLLEAFAQDMDVHLLTASRILQVALDIVTKPQRQEYGKRTNFALLYGAGWHRFHKDYALEKDEARRIVEAWHASYPEIRQWIDRQKARAQADGYVMSPFGRRRRLPEANHHDDKLRARALLQAVNFPAQSIGTDLNTLSFNTAQGLLKREGLVSRGIGLTHDSQTYDVHPAETEQVAEIVAYSMVPWVQSACPWLGVPLGVELKAGPSWGELAPLEPSQGSPAPGRGRTA